MRSTKPLPDGRGLPQSIRAATVIGLGGVGRCVAMQLAALRVPRLLLIDPGNVPRTKYAADGFLFEDAGRARAHTTAQLCHQIHPELDLNSITERSVRRVGLGDAVFCCQCAGKDWRTATSRASNRIIVATCDVREARIHLENARGRSELGVPLDDPQALASRIIHPTLPIHIATVAAGLFVTEFIRFAESAARSRVVRFDLADLQPRIIEPA